MTVNVREAKTHLSRLLKQVEMGEVIGIAKAGRPIARLSPYHDEAPERQEGRDRGLFTVPDPDRCRTLACTPRRVTSRPPPGPVRSPPDRTVTRRGRARHDRRPGIQSVRRFGHRAVIASARRAQSGGSSVRGFSAVEELGIAGVQVAHGSAVDEPKREKKLLHRHVRLIC